VLSSICLMARFESMLFLTFFQILERSVLRNAVFFGGSSQVARMVTGREECSCVRTVHSQLSFIFPQFIAMREIAPRNKYRPQNIS